MFGWLKPAPAPEGPVSFEQAMEIERAAPDLYRMLDFGDELCWKREVGTIETVGEKRYRMLLDLLPGHDIWLDVCEAEPGRIYAYDCRIEPRIGRLLTSRESYAIEPLGEGACRITLQVVAGFEPGLTKRQWREETEMMRAALNNTLVKLKIHAESGVEAIREIEHLQKIA